MGTLKEEIKSTKIFVATKNVRAGLKELPSHAIIREFTTVESIQLCFGDAFMKLLATLNGEKFKFKSMLNEFMNEAN